MSKRILMIADSANFWTKNYVMNLLVENDWQVVIFPIWKENPEMSSFYAQHGVTVYHDRYRLPVIRHIPRLRLWVRILLNARKLIKLGPFDVVHNHILSQRDLALGYLVKRRNPHASWVASFWGSDLLRASQRAIRQMRFFLQKADHITVNAMAAIPILKEKYPAAITDKTSVTYFGQHIYDTIDTLRRQHDRSACKAHFGLATDQLLIAVGYNASPTQRHLEIIQAIQAIPQETTANWSLVFQVTYGGSDPAYLDTVRRAAAQLPCRLLFLTEPMDETECAYLRIAADAYIHAIPTDFLSATLREYLYTGTNVLCGDWLPYPEFTKLGIPMNPFAALHQLSTLLPKVLNSPVTQQEMQRRLMLKDMFSWHTVTDHWNALYHV